MIWVLISFIYLVVAGSVAAGWAKKEGATVFGADHPGFFFAGLLWPIVVPIAIGARIVEKLIL